MPSRRDVLRVSGQMGALVAAGACVRPGFGWQAAGATVNDVQSQLNATRVHGVLQPTSVAEIHTALREAQRAGRAISASGGRHSMGGQQFAEDALLLDLRRFNRVLKLDKERGQVEVEAGIEWPELIEYLHREQRGEQTPWAIRQKQTGVDRVTIGGALASNIHGRGLRLPPFVSDVESFIILDAEGRERVCSRRENQELFSLAIGGYGLFGIITQVTLQLVPRTKVQRVVKIIQIKDLLSGVDERVQQGFVFGDCQYSTDLTTDAESHPGVFSCYRPVADETPLPEGSRQLGIAEWRQLYQLARTDKKQAFEKYSRYYLGTTGQVYWSDLHQLSKVFEAYREAVTPERGTEMITEAYLTRDAFLPFLTEVRKDFLQHQVDMTYGTIRFIEKDEVTFLPWARQPWVCIVCNLHVSHTEAGVAKAQSDFRRILDRIIEFRGSYYLTYHRWATRRHVETCYPQFVDFLRLKAKYDPRVVFQSNWYRHYKALFADKL